MKLIAREPTAEMSAVGGQYPGIGMLGDYESRRRSSVNDVVGHKTF